MPKNPIGAVYQWSLRRAETGSTLSPVWTKHKLGPATERDTPSEGPHTYTWLWLCDRSLLNVKSLQSRRSSEPTTSSNVGHAEVPTDWGPFAGAKDGKHDTLTSSPPLIRSGFRYHRRAKSRKQAGPGVRFDPL